GVRRVLRRWRLRVSTPTCVGDQQRDHEDRSAEEKMPRIREHEFLLEAAYNVQPSGQNEGDRTAQDAMRPPGLTRGFGTAPRIPETGAGSRQPGATRRVAGSPSAMSEFSPNRTVPSGDPECVVVCLPP